MTRWLTQLDDLLRGRRTDPQSLADGRVRISAPGFLTLAIVLGALYGLFMGLFAVINRSPTELMQLVASMVKLPALFLLTLLITFPSLYVFNALVGCRLTAASMLRLLVGAIVVNLAVAASFGPILGFFTLSTTSYSFMVVLNVALLGIAGVVGLGFLLKVLRRLADWQAAQSWFEQTADAATPPKPDAAVPPGGDAASTAAHPTRAKLPPPAGGPTDPAGMILRVWLLIYAMVGAQMGWILRPFIGSPNLPFEWFRPRSGNFIEGLAGAIRSLVDVSHR
ncbi:MAG: hypothetical protein IT450_14665 [Phycisphaerales bacterium]|nr:hypothetical protein [Phycisphaerales bacterium]